MNDLINLPESARRADFAPFLAAGEVATRATQLSETGKRYVEEAAGYLKAGDIAVRFERVIEYTGRRGNGGTFKGWRKVVIGAVTGSGKVFNSASTGYNDMQRFYFGE